MRTREEIRLVAAGDSILIDDYTDVPQGGAANQFAELLGPATFKNLAFDGCLIDEIPENDIHGDVIVLSMGGNDLIEGYEAITKNPRAQLRDFKNRYEDKLKGIRERNPDAAILVNNIYEPAAGLNEFETHILDKINQIIVEVADKYDAHLVDIHSAFDGESQQLLVKNIEPNYEGATRIAESLMEVFRENYRSGR